MLNHLKGALRSVTVWFNVMFAMFAENFDTIRDSLPQMQSYMTPAMFGKLTITCVVINLLLRAKTKQSLAAKVQKDTLFK